MIYTDIAQCVTMVKLAAFRARLRRRQSLTLSLEAVVNSSRSAVLRCIRCVISEENVNYLTPNLIKIVLRSYNQKVSVLKPCNDPDL
jgi:hypothetical protein